MAKLGDICKVAAGQGAPQGEHNYCDFNEGIPFIKAGDLNDLISGKSERDIQCVKHDVANQHKLKLYPEGSILFAKSGMSCMKGYVYRTKHPCYVVSHLAIVIPEKVDGEYLKFYFQYRKPNYLIKDSAYPSISLQDISNIELNLPSNGKQNDIAASLNKISNLISLRKQQLSKLDELVKARFVELFGDINTNDKGWESQPLGELCTIVRGGSPRPIDNYLGGDVPWIKIGDATKGDNVYLHSTKEHIIQDGVKKSRMVKSGSLIFANCGVSLGFARIITFDGCIHDGWLAMEDIDERLDKVFLLQALNQMTDHFRKIAPAGTQPNLNTAIMKAYVQIIPPVELQKEYIAFVEQADKSKLAIQQSLEKLETLKKALMQKYFG